MEIAADLPLDCGFDGEEFRATQTLVRIAVFAISGFAAATNFLAGTVDSLNC